VEGTNATAAFVNVLKLKQFLSEHVLETKGIPRVVRNPVNHVLF
jgi:hypothetical protein